jgi:hypothetical protein
MRLPSTFDDGAHLIQPHRINACYRRLHLMNALRAGLSRGGRPTHAQSAAPPFRTPEGRLHPEPNSLSPSVLTPTFLQRLITVGSGKASSRNKLTRCARRRTLASATVTAHRFQPRR